MLEELEESVIKSVNRSGFRAIKLTSPADPDNRSIDMFLWREDGKTLHLKIAVDANDIDYIEQRDLYAVGSILNSKPLLISEYESKIELEDDVVYERNRLPLVNVRTLEDLLSCSEHLYIVGKKKDFFVRIDGKKLREARLNRNISIGELADMLRVSRKSVYEYEKGSYNISIDIAEKLVDVLTEEILKPFNIFEEDFPHAVKINNKPDNTLEEKIMEVVSEMTDTYYHVKRAFVDLIARVGDKKLFIIVEHLKSSTPLNMKIEDAEKISFIKDSMKLVVTASSPNRYDTSILITNVNDFKNVLKETLK